MLNMPKSASANAAFSVGSSEARIENTDISFRYRYIESYRIGRLNIDFVRYMVMPDFRS